jgi:anthranilate phosphoribosyltransferase
MAPPAQAASENGLNSSGVHFSPKDAIKKVGRGKTLSQDLNATEARHAFSGLLDGRFSPVQFGAFLQALRIKELSQDELNALYTEVLARTAVPETGVGEVKLALNLASDTARKGGLLGLLAAQVLTANGLSIGVVRSAPVMTRNEASYEKTRGFRPNSKLASELTVAESVSGWSAFDALRHELGFRSCLHTVEKLVNPWQQAPLVLGISHKQYADRLAAAMQAQGRSGFIVLGNHGTVDLVLHKPTEVVVVKPAGTGTLWVDPTMGGLKPDAGVYSLGRFEEWGTWLNGAAPEGFRDALILQTAFLAHGAGGWGSLEAAWPSATSWVHAWMKGLELP